MYFLNFQSGRGLMPFCERVQFGPLLTFKFNVFFMFTFTPQPTSPLHADLDQKLHKNQAYVRWKQNLWVIFY